LWDRLLREELGYERYGAAGGDLGGQVATELGMRHTDSVIGIYVSTSPLFHVGGLEGLKKEQYAPDEAGWLEKSIAMVPAVTSHVAVHSRDPQTLAWALNDSPVGLAAWLLERRRAWSDCDGDLERAFTRDFLLSSVSLYWFTNSLGSSIRIYPELFNTGSFLEFPELRGRIEAPTGFGVYPEDISLFPRSAAERVANLVFRSVHTNGGHFAPAEVPAVYLDDLRACFRLLR
jgi:pimeloyl-ACP methyl ester carboxylesterase